MMMAGEYSRSTAGIRRLGRGLLAIVVILCLWWIVDFDSAQGKQCLIPASALNQKTASGWVGNQIPLSSRYAPTVAGADPTALGWVPTDVRVKRGSQFRITVQGVMTGCHVQQPWTAFQAFEATPGKYKPESGWQGRMRSGLASDPEASPSDLLVAHGSAALLTGLAVEAQPLKLAEKKSSLKEWSYRISANETTDYWERWLLKGMPDRGGRQYRPVAEDLSKNVQDMQGFDARLLDSQWDRVKNFVPSVGGKIQWPPYQPEGYSFFDTQHKASELGGFLRLPPSALISLSWETKNMKDLWSYQPPGMGLTARSSELGDVEPHYRVYNASKKLFMRLVPDPKNKEIAQEPWEGLTAMHRDLQLSLLPYEGGRWSLSPIPWSLNGHIVSFSPSTSGDFTNNDSYRFLTIDPSALVPVTDAVSLSLLRYEQGETQGAMTWARFFYTPSDSSMVLGVRLMQEFPMENGAVNGTVRSTGCALIDGVPHDLLSGKPIEFDKRYAVDGMVQYAIGDVGAITDMTTGENLPAQPTPNTKLVLPDGVFYDPLQNAFVRNTMDGAGTIEVYSFDNAKGGYVQWKPDGTTELVIRMNNDGSLEMASSPASPPPDANKANESKLPPWMRTALDIKGGDRGIQTGVLREPQSVLQADVSGPLWIRLVGGRNDSRHEMLYQVTVERAAGDEFIASILDSIWNPVQESLKTTARDLFNRTVGNKSFQDIMKLCLMLYVAWYGYQFTMMSIKDSKYDLVQRMVRIGVIVALIQPGSWAFFYNNIFGYLIDSQHFLINLLTGYDTSSSSAFNFIDNGFLHLLGNGHFWLRMFSFLSLGIVPSTYLGSQAAVGASFVVLLPALLAALMLMLTGFLMFVLLAYAVVKYAITCADVLIKYLQQTVILFLLIGTGPIFIGMILFERTKPFFDKWKSLCVGSMFQPVLIIAMLVFVDSLVMEWLFALFDFDACLECTINIDLSLGFVPGKLATICIGSTYVPNIPLMHLGEFFAKLIGYSLLVHMASHVVSTAETLSNRLFGTFELQVAGVMR